MQAIYSSDEGKNLRRPPEESGKASALDQSEVYNWLQALSPGLKLEHLSVQFESRGIRSRRSLSYEKRFTGKYLIIILYSAIVRNRDKMSNHF